MTPDNHIIKRAIISVSDKTGIVELARGLTTLGIEIISTGGTAKLLSDHGIAVKKVADLTQFPEIMDGRVKTLHPAIHGGLLAELDKDEHLQNMRDHGIESIDLAIINLYPFSATLENPSSTHEEIIENIDIGGPAMVRASAKNHRWTAVVINPSHYGEVLRSIENTRTITLTLREQLATEAFEHTAMYDSIVASYLRNHTKKEFASEMTIGGKLAQSLRYGENPHQSAILYGDFSKIFTQLHGKELSYNNIVDIDAGSKLLLEFSEPTVVIVKHTNPCGVGSSSDLVSAWDKAFATDTVSPFGGVVAVNREVDIDFANHIHSIFTEVIIAPSFTDAALEILKKKKDRRLIAVNPSALAGSFSHEVKTVAGGFLLQSSDGELLSKESLRVVTERQPSLEEYAAMMFAWRVAKHVKSNAIVYSSGDRTLAIGAGQMSRLDSARIAVKKAEDAGIQLKGCAVASDAFFPFADGLLQAVSAGATCAIQPGGSVRDEEVIAAANEHGIAMVFTGMRHFKH